MFAVVSLTALLPTPKQPKNELSQRILMILRWALVLRVSGRSSSFGWRFARRLRFPLWVKSGHLHCN